MTHDLYIGEGAVLVFTDPDAAERVADAIRAERHALFQLDGIPISVRDSHRDRPAAVPEPAADVAVEFASPAAAKLAGAEDLTEADFEGVEASSEGGYTKADVERAIATRDA